MMSNLRDWANAQLFIGWCLGADWTARVVQQLDVMPYCGKLWSSAWSHVYLKFAFKDEPDWILESHVKGGVQATPYERFLKAVKDGRVLRYYEHPIALDQAGVARVWDKGISLHGASYDWRHILGLYLFIHWYGRTAEKQPWWLDWSNNNKYLCSEFTREALAAGPVDICRQYSTPATTTPHSQWMAVFDVPSIMAVRCTTQVQGLVGNGLLAVLDRTKAQTWLTT